MKQTFDRLVDDLMDRGFFLEQAVEILERTLIARTLERTGGNRSAASKLLGIHRNTLQRKMVAYDVGGTHSRRKPMARAGHLRKKKAAAG